ncbi:hypothetical protein IWZ00DRAFT_367079 [Phyllosticta capitalensis]
MSILHLSLIFCHLILLEDSLSHCNCHQIILFASPSVAHIQLLARNKPLGLPSNTPESKLDPARTETIRMQIISHQLLRG